MATGQHDSAHEKAEVNEYLDYFDVMLLGKTGTGKTTTADKLLMANPTGKDYSYVPPGHDSAASSIEVPDNHSLQDTSTASSQDASASSTSRLDVAKRNITSLTQYHDISMWHLSDEPDELETVSSRLKNLVFWRCLEKPHEEVNTTRRRESKSTEMCELLSNDTSKVRVLDVPGFYGSNAASSTSVCERALATAENDLSVMRKILHIKMAKKFKFDRIAYFLPETGVLIRDSQILQMEIGLMEHYFGRSIFECMVVVATHNQSAYRNFAKGVDLYPSEDIDTTRRFLQAALHRVFNSDDVPVPPIIFISLFDSCEEVLCKIRDSQVVREGVNLCFNPFTCARCNVKIRKLKEESHKRRILKEGEKEEDVVAMCTRDSWSDAIPYEDSTCHPMMIPKYSKIKCVVGGIAHVVTFRIFLGRWPSFGNLEEVCINCGALPKVRGCLRVGTDYIHNKSKGTIRVDHTSKVLESYEIVQDPDNEPQEEDADTMAEMGHEHAALTEACLTKSEEQQKLEEGGGD